MYMYVCVLCIVYININKMTYRSLNAFYLHLVYLNKLHDKSTTVLFKMF